MNITDIANLPETHKPAIAALISRWAEVAAENEDMQRHMAQSILDQISGEWDMSAEDMDDEMAALMGWQMPMTDEQAEEWKTIVDHAAEICGDLIK